MSAMDTVTGTNSLRGGRKIYGHKTLVSNWIEETYKPDVTAGGFTTQRFVTTAAEAAAQGYCGKPLVAQTFGSGIQKDASADRYDYANVINPDTEACSGVCVCGV